MSGQSSTGWPVPRSSLVTSQPANQQWGDSPQPTARPSRGLLPPTGSRNSAPPAVARQGGLVSSQRTRSLSTKLQRAFASVYVASSLSLHLMKHGIKPPHTPVSGRGRGRGGEPQAATRWLGSFTPSHLPGRKVSRSQGGRRGNLCWFIANPALALKWPTRSPAPPDLPWGPPHSPK